MLLKIGPLPISVSCRDVYLIETHLSLRHGGFTSSSPQASWPFLGHLSHNGKRPCNFFSSAGEVFAQTRASGVSSDGTFLTLQTPNLGSFYTGTYGLKVENVKANETFEAVGGALIDIYGADPPPYPEPEAQTCPEAGGYQGFCE